MVKIKPPYTHLIILLVICIFIFSYFFEWIGFILGIIIGIFLSMIIDSIKGVRYWNRCITAYKSLTGEGYTKDQALIEISKSAHPELKLSTHGAIINKFNDINLLVNFMTSALPPNKNDDEFALEILNNTSIQHSGGNKYKVITNHKGDNPT